MAVKKKTVAEYRAAAVLLRATYPYVVYNSLYHAFNVYPTMDNKHHYLDPDTLEDIPLADVFERQFYEPHPDDTRRIPGKGNAVG